MFILLENLGIYYYFIVQTFNSKVIDHLLNSLHMIEVLYFYVTSALIFPTFIYLKNIYKQNSVKIIFPYGKPENPVTFICGGTSHKKCHPN